MRVTTAKWTIDEYHRMIAAGILEDRRVELLQGEIVEILPEGEPHEAGEYASRATLTGGIIYPLAFPDISISIDSIVTVDTQL